MPYLPEEGYICTMGTGSYCYNVCTDRRTEGVQRSWSSKTWNLTGPVPAGEGRLPLFCEWAHVDLYAHMGKITGQGPVDRGRWTKRVRGVRTMGPAAPRLLCEVEERLGDRVRVQALRRRRADCVRGQSYHQMFPDTNAPNRRLQNPSCRVLARCRSGLHVVGSGKLETVSM